MGQCVTHMYESESTRLECFFECREVGWQQANVRDCTFNKHAKMIAMIMYLYSRFICVKVYIMHC